MDVDTKLDMVKDPTSGTDNYISQFVFESCEMRHEKREKRYFSIIVLLIVLLVATNVAWLFYEAQFKVHTSEKRMPPQCIENRNISINSFVRGYLDCCVSSMSFLTCSKVR